MISLLEGRSDILLGFGTKNALIGTSIYFLGDMYMVLSSSLMK